MANTGPTVDPSTLTAIAAACRDSLRLRFDYHTHDHASSIRKTEPHRLVHAGRRWYLIGWDVDRKDWRTDRVDRLDRRTPTGPRSTRSAGADQRAQLHPASRSNSLDELAIYVTTKGFDLQVHEPPELVEHVQTLAARLAAATDWYRGRVGAAGVA